MSDKGVFTYKRFMRDGSTEERTAIINDPKRVRNGKTQRDHNKRKHSHGDS